jgi:thiol-disulfide isomerase/thioredoxin
MLLVNWSPFCGFCDRIGPDFADVQSDLRGRGIELVLLALGEAEANRDLLARHGLECTVLLQRGNVEAFYGLGTPSAYLIDLGGKVASPLALGADQVPTLAREAAGRE